MQKEHFGSGIRAAMPVCLGVIPVGVSYGLMAMQAGLTGWEAVGMSIFVMAGSSQMMAIGMLGQGAAIFTIITATFFLNLRHIVMSSSVMNRLGQTSIAKKLVCAFALCDESFAVFSFSGKNSSSFLLGINTAVYGAWVGSSLAGCMVNRFLPEIIINSFGIAFYAAFLAMLTPHMAKSKRILFLVLITAAFNTILGHFLPSSWAVILSMVAGAWGGTFMNEEERPDET